MDGGASPKEIRVKRILLDTNIVLDVLLDRHPFADQSHQIWRASDEGLFDACIASFSIPTIYYICNKQQGKEAASRAIDLCLQAFEIAALYRECILAAQVMAGPDFEDDLQIASAITDFMHGIVTRDPTGFAASPLQTYSPIEFLEELNR
jgi:predicted nucleic acid-binding protein